MMSARSSNYVAPTIIGLKAVTTYTKIPNPPPAQSRLHKFAISGVPVGERVHTKVCSMSDLRRRREKHAT
jgi:hypothetical protein